MADRAAVSLDQTASPHPPLSRQQRQRHPSQLFAAMIAYALLRIAARSHCIKISILRFTDLVALCLFERRPIGAIDKPPPVNPSRPQCQNSPNQLTLSYA